MGQAQFTVLGAWQRKKHTFSHLFRLHERHQTRMQAIFSFRIHVFLNSLSTVDIGCIDIVTFTPWKLCRLMNDSKCGVLCLLCDAPYRNLVPRVISLPRQVAKGPWERGWPYRGHPTNVFYKLANQGTRIRLTDTLPCKVSTRNWQNENLPSTGKSSTTLQDTKDCFCCYM